MAIILTRGAARTVAATPSFPLRSNTIEIEQTGVIKRVVGPSGQSVNVVNLGYQGDNRVTELRVKPVWASAETLEANYIASLVFYNEKTTKSMSYDLQRSGEEYHLLVPKDVTEPGGNYQIFLALKERIGGSEGGSGLVGSEDEPAYREVFVSAAFKGAVNTNSGYQYIKDIKNFNWETSVYDYEKGMLQVGDRTWTPIIEGGDSYSTSIKLGGIKSTATESDIKLHNTESFAAVTKSFNTDTAVLTLTIQLNSGDKLDLLDDIVVEYPVNFSARLGVSGYAQKPAVEIKYDASKLEIVSSNKSLGMKLDTYVTPVDITNIPELETTTSRYTIFSKDNRTYVCQAKSEVTVNGEPISGGKQVCWIPVGVTDTPGVWNVSFVGRDDANTYYTDVLKLSVVDNVLTKESLNSDTVYVAMQSDDGTQLYDENNHALYLINDGLGDGKLNYSRDNVNTAIGWVLGVCGEDGVESTQLKQAIQEIPTIKSEISTISTTLNNAVDTIQSNSGAIENLSLENAKRINEIAALNQKIQDSDTTVLEARVSEAEVSIDSLEQNLDHTTQRVTTAENNIILLEAANTTLGGRVTSNETSINTINSKITTLESVDSGHDTKINQNKASIERLRSDVDYINNNTIVNINDQISTINNTLEDYGKAHGNYLELLNSEKERAIKAEVSLGVDINTEASRATEAEGKIANDLLAEMNRAIEEENALKNRASANEENIKNLQDGLKTEIKERAEKDSEIDGKIEDLSGITTQHNSAIGALRTEVTTIKENPQYIKNDYLTGVVKPIVSKIVLIEPKSIEALAEMVDVPCETPEELTAWKNELLEAGIITLEDDLNNISAESVYDTLKLKNKIEINTLYLLREEE